MCVCQKHAEALGPDCPTSDPNFGQVSHVPDENASTTLKRTEIAPGQWEVTQIAVNMRGKAVLVKNISVQQNELHADFQRVPNDLNLSDAADLPLKHAYGAKAFASVPEFADATGVRVSLSPVQEPLPTVTDATEREIANDFQSKLLRFRMCRGACGVKPGT
jgi:hypothetical protein